MERIHVLPVPQSHGEDTVCFGVAGLLVRPGFEGYVTMPCGTQTGRFRQPSPDQGHFRIMVHPVPVQRPWATLPEFPARKHKNSQELGLVRALGFEDTLTSTLWGWLGHGQSPGSQLTSRAVSELPSSQLKVIDLLGLWNCFKSAHPGQASPSLSSGNMCLSLFLILSAVLCSKLRCTVLHCI